MELLVKYITGEASPEEAMVVEGWIEAAPENRQQFEQLQQAWTAAAPVGKAYQQPNVEQSWNAIKQAVTQAPVRNIKYRRVVSMLVAASVLALAGILGWLVLQQNSTTEMVTLQAQSIRQEQLPDQSVATLDANSSITYRKDFNKTAARTLSFTGEGFFNVTHHPRRPFIVDMDGVRLQVLGTSFRILNDIAAQKVQVDVATGKVMLYNELDTLVLMAGQSGSYDRKAKRFLLHDTVNINNYSYATRQFAFTDTPLDKVAAYLEKTYGVEIQFQNPAIKTCRLSAQFDQQPIEEILEVIAGTFGISYTKERGVVFLDGKGCQ